LRKHADLPAVQVIKGLDRSCVLRPQRLSSASIS
jgi:hypothetical protein